MTESEQNLMTIFSAALDRESAAARAAYLDEACKDRPDLRERVEALLRAHERVGGFLCKPAPQLPAEEVAAGAATGATQGESSAVDGAADHLGFLTPADRPGVLGLLGHYDILEVVGRGGMGIVLKAFDEQLHRVVAIKVMAQQLATNATARKRFTRESQAQAAVSHDHVVTIHAVEEANGLPYLVMQYVAGRSLQQRLDRDGPLQLQEILRIGMQIASGLAAAHAQGLVHRDIKPANILLENGVERVKIADFGLARAASEASLTQSGMVAGTPQYMSPEQAEGKPIDQRTDLFSLGSVLYAMCTGRPPFRAPSTLAVLKQVCEAAPQPIRESYPEAPAWLVEIVARLHAKNPAERFQSAAEVAELLGRRLAEIQHPTDDPIQPGPVVETRRRRWPRVAAALLLVAVGLGLMEAAGVIRLVPALHRAASGPAPGNEEGERASASRDSAASEGPGPALRSGEGKSVADLKRDGAFGFPQAQATVLCDDVDLCLSFWNNRAYLYVQAIFWKGGDDSVVITAGGMARPPWSNVLLDVDADGKKTPQVDRVYTLYAGPYMRGLLYQFYDNAKGMTGFQSDTTGRGAIRSLVMADGSRVRVDLLVVSLAEIKKRPGDRLRLAYYGYAPKPDLTVNSIGYQVKAKYFPINLPWEKFHEVTLADRPDALDLQAVPDGTKDVLRSK
jgi:serine/threonine protein kinase